MKKGKRRKEQRFSKKVTWNKGKEVGKKIKGKTEQFTGKIA